MQMSAYGRAKAVVQSDTVKVAPGFTAKAIYCGGAAAHDLKVTTNGGDVVVFTGVPPGTIVPVAPKLIWDTGTTFADADMLVLGD